MGISAGQPHDPGAPPYGGPDVIPYADEMAGRRRQLELTLRRATPLVPVGPTVSIDGRAYVVSWGSVVFEVPADRPVWVGVSIQGYGQASFVLAPEMLAQLEYRAPVQGFAQGQIGPPGTVKHRGGALMGCALAVLGALLILLFLMILALVL